MEVKKNFLTYKLSKELEQLMTKYDLSIGDIYWVLKSLFLQVEKMYLDQANKEFEEIQAEEADKRDREGEQVDERSNDLDSE